MTRGFKVGKHGRRNTKRTGAVERNVPLIGRVIEAAYGEPTNAATGDLAAQRLGGTTKAAAYLLERLPKHMALLEQHGCHRSGRPACSTCPVRNLCAYWRENNADVPKGERVLDLFCGAGGMSLGFEQAGYVPHMAVDLDLDAILTYRANRPWATEQSARCDNIVDMLHSGEFRRMAGQISGVIGGPPCQTFSLVGLRTKRLDDRDATIAADQRTWLPVKMAEIISDVRPEFCVMENVPSFLSALGGKVHETTRKIIQDAGYSVTEVKIRAERHGTPQLRTRYVLIGIRNTAVHGKRRAEELLRDLAQTIEEGTRNPMPLQEALQPLAVFGVIEAGRGSEYLRAGNKETWNHYARAHNTRDRAIYAALKPGETASQLEERAKGSIPYDLSSFHDKYRKLDPTKPSPTIPAHLSRDANSFILDGVNRGLTPREAAILQGFPVDYMFLGEQTHQFRQVGNAVPPPVAKMVAELVREALKKGKDRTWKPVFVGGRGPAPAKHTLVLRKELLRLKETGKVPPVAEFLHWAARRLQTPKADLRETVYREYRKIIRHG